MRAVYLKSPSSEVSPQATQHSAQKHMIVAHVLCADLHSAPALASACKSHSEHPWLHPSGINLRISFLQSLPCPPAQPHHVSGPRNLSMAAFLRTAVSRQGASLSHGTPEPEGQCPALPLTSADARYLAGSPWEEGGRLSTCPLGKVAGAPPSDPKAKKTGKC